MSSNRTIEYSTFEPGKCSIRDWLPEIRRFRESIYAKDGVSIAATDYLDHGSWQILALDEARLIGCLRYTPLSGSLSLAGGWAVEPGYGTVAVKLVKLGIEIGKTLGHRVIACATDRHNSARILQRLGGVPIAYNFDSSYGCVMTTLMFDFTGKQT